MRASISTVALAVLLAALTACGGSGGESEAEPVTTVAPPAETGAPPAATTSAGPDVPFSASLDAPTGPAAVGTRWHYRVTVTDESGAPLAARLTVEIVDPLQQAHPVDYDATTDPIVDRPIEGVFEDYVEWPPESKGVPLTLRLTIVADGESAELTFPVTPT